MTTFDLQATRHTSRVLAEWVGNRPGAASRITGVKSEATDGKVVVSSDRLAMLDLFGVAPAAAGMHVTPESAMRVSAVFACVRIISGAIASLPLHIYQRTLQGRQRVEASPIWDLLNVQPTDRYTAASHWEGVGIGTQLRGDSFSFIARERSGAPREFVPLPWGAVRVERHTTATSDRVKYFVQDAGKTWGVDQDDMLHFPGFGFDGLRGMSVIQWAARNAAGSAMAMDEYSGRFFAGGAHPSIVLETTGKMNEALITNLQTAFVEKYSGMTNSHRLPLVLTEGLKATNLSMSAEDAQLIEARQFQVVDIARAFGVPPHLIGETSASTSWGTGIEAMGRAFITFALQTHLNRIEQELNRKLFKGVPGTYVEFNRDALLEGDSASQSKLFRSALGGPGQGPGYMSVDEVRSLKNLKPLGGRCAEVYFPPEKPATTPKDEDEDQDPAAAAA